MQKKKMFSLILALALAVSAMCYPALAASEEEFDLPATDEMLNIPAADEVVAPEDEDVIMNDGIYYMPRYIYNGTWYLTHSSSSIYGEIIQDTCTTVATTSNYVREIQSACTSFYYDESSTGTMANATYRIEYVTNTGNSGYLGGGEHNSRGENDPVDVPSNIANGTTFYGYYETGEDTELYYNFEGTLSEP